MKLGILTDIHEDIENLKKALRIFEKEQCQELVCLGDIIGYSDAHYDFKDTRDASACVDVIKQNFNIVVAGNHDLFAIKKIPFYKAGFDYPDDWYEMEYEKRKELSNNRTWDYEKDELPLSLNREEINFLDSLPEYKVEDFDGMKIMFSHFSYPNLSASLTTHPTKAKHLKEHFQFMEEKDCLLSFSGHAHYQGIAIATKRCFRVRSYGKHILKNKKQWISLPCTVRNDKQNAVSIFDTKTMALETICL
jgi:predicted phosphodiesterase